MEFHVVYPLISSNGQCPVRVVEQNRSCFLSFAACRTPFNPWDIRFPLCVGRMLDGTMFSSVCALPSQTSAEGCPSLFGGGDRKSTRLNSSHTSISYAVFCLKKKTPLRKQC